MDKPQIIAHVQKSLNYTVFDSKWLPRTAKFVTLGSHPRNTGALQIYEITQGDVILVKEAEKAKAFKCGTFGASPSGSWHLATGDFEGRLNIWDIDHLEVPVYATNAHSQIINCIDGIGGCGVGEGAPEIVTGSRDGSVKVWDPRQKDEPVACMECTDKDNARDCWSVAFGDAHNSSDRCVAAGYDNGDLKLFDLRAMSLRWETNLKNGICGLEFDRKDVAMNKLAATTLESKIHVFDMRTQHPTLGFASVTERAHKSTVWSVRHLPQNRDVCMTTGGNGSLCLWHYSYPDQRVKNKGDEPPEGVAGSLQLLQNVTLSTQPIAGYDWSPDKLGLAVCTSFDQSLRVLIVTLYIFIYIMLFAFLCLNWTV